MTEERLKLGRRGEDAAAKFLKRQGMKIVARNLRTPVGEIDLIARDRQILAFVEVKTRRGIAFGSPGEAVGPRKQHQIAQAAKWYLNEVDHKALQPRFDVIAITVNGDDLQVDHIPDAFEL